MSATRTVLIVGGGASGTLMALQLLAQAPAEIRITLVERNDDLGRGLAYATADEAHLLNVMPKSLSAFPDDPEHFWRWLQRTARVPVGTGPAVFVARHHFGDYLAAMLAEARSASHGRLSVLQGEVTTLLETDAGIEARLSSGASVPAHAAILATGHDDDCPADEAIRGIPPDTTQPILILGSGLSMIDRWLSLRGAGFRGRIVAMSRRGLLPQPHTGTAPIRLDAADIPFGTGLPYFAHWLRGMAKDAAAETGDWRAATDAIRPFSQRLWQSWSEATRRRFLRHARPWWDVHRHRLAPAVHARLMAERSAETVAVIAAKLTAAEPGIGPQTIRYRRRGSAVVETLEVAAVLDCRGLARDWEARPGTLVGTLIAEGRGRPDPLRIGLDVSENCEVIDSDGRVSPRLCAIGPLTRGTFFEIEAVPDIRAQCTSLAAALCRRLLQRAA